MELLTKFARGEFGLARTFWLGYLGIGLVIAVIGMSLVTFVIPAGGHLLIFVALAWALFASWAVIKAAAYSGSRSIWGWIITLYVIMASGASLFSLGKIFLL